LQATVLSSKIRVSSAQYLLVLASVRQAEHHLEKHLLSGQVCFKLTPHNSENEFLAMDQF
jgi:hypothetical protein